MDKRNRTEAETHSDLQSLPRYDDVKKIKSLRFSQAHQIHFPGETVGYIMTGADSPAKFKVDSIRANTNQMSYDWKKGKRQGFIGLANVIGGEYEDA